MMKKIDGIVYKATSPSGKVYIGITITSVKERKRLHIKEANNGSLFPFHAAIRKYGSHNILWEVIDTATTWESLCELEIEFIEKYNSKNKGYNMTLGGEGTYGLKHNDEWCAANSRRRKSYFTNPDNRRNQSIANKKAHAENPGQAKHHSEFMKERFTKAEEREEVASGMRRFLSDSDTRIIHSIQRGARPFVVYKDGDTIGEWLTQWQCARDLGLDVGHISACLHGRRKSHGGFTFKYKPESS
jgi:group I intron endonuclease